MTTKPTPSTKIDDDTAIKIGLIVKRDIIGPAADPTDKHFNFWVKEIEYGQVPTRAKYVASAHGYHIWRLAAGKNRYEVLCEKMGSSGDL